MNDLAGRVAIVTGAANGIGLAIASALSGRGANVVVADVECSATEAAVAELPTRSASWIGDLTAREAPDAVVATAIETFGALHIVVNNAGYSRNSMIEEMSEDIFRDVLEIDLVTPWRLLKGAAPHLKDAAVKTGVASKVVNVSSMAAYGSAHGQSNYTSAKAGLIGLTKSLAREWGPNNVCVNAIAPGMIDTRLMRPRTEESLLRIGDRSVPYGLAPEVAAQYSSSLSTIPLRRSGSAKEVAETAAFLCTSGSDYLTGQVLNVGGGITVGMSS